MYAFTPEGFLDRRKHENGLVGGFFLASLTDGFFFFQGSMSVEKMGHPFLFKFLFCVRICHLPACVYDSMSCTYVQKSKAIKITASRSPQ